MNRQEVREIIGLSVYEICRHVQQAPETEYCRPTCRGGLDRDKKRYKLKPCFHDPKRLELLQKRVRKTAGDNAEEVLEFLRKFAPEGEGHSEQTAKEPQISFMELRRQHKKG